MTELDDVKRVVAEYWDTRTAIRKAQRVELEERLAQARDNIAFAVTTAKVAGHSISDQAAYIGITNRNFLYKALNDRPLNDSNASTRPAGRPHGSGKPQPVDISVPTSNLTYQLEWTEPEHFINAVWIDPGKDEPKRFYALKWDGYGKLAEIPEAWYASDLTPEELVFYQNLIREIEAHG